MLTTTISTLNDTIYDWIFSVLPGRECIIKNNVDDAAPNRPYVMFSLTNDQTFSKPVIERVHEPNETVTESIYFRNLFTVSIQVVGNDGPDHSCLADINLLAASIWSQQRYLDLWQISGLGGISIQPQNITSAAYGVNRTRWQMEFTLYANTRADTVDVDYMDKVPTEIIDGGNDTIIYNGDLADNPNDYGCN